MDESARVNALQLKVAELERKLEFVMRHLGVEYREAPLAPGLREAADLLRKGNKLEALNAYRRATGCSLIDAKNAVEALEQSLVGK